MASYEQRGTFRLLSYWNSIKEDKKFPDLSEISLGDMGELWDFCFVLEIKDASHIEFQHFGSELITVFGEDYTGKTLEDAALHAVLADLGKFIEEVWVMEAPVSHCGDVDERTLAYRSLLAPLTENGDDKIHYLIGTTNFRARD